MSGIEEYIKNNAKLIDERMAEYLEKNPGTEFMESLLGKTDYAYDTDAIKKSVSDPSWYLLGLGGKRWRPALTLLFIEALGKDTKEFLDFAIIPEIIHNATLVHDDIEDNSDTRRGSPAIHIKFGMDVATNLGDFLYFFPILALLKKKRLRPKTQNKILELYLENMLRVTVGQAVDIAWHSGFVNVSDITEDKYLEMALDKTGVLARFACELAGALSDADDKTTAAIGKFGATVGVAFQIQDDILNIYKSEVSQSKGGVGDDISEGKITLLVLYTLKMASPEERNTLLKILSEHTKNKGRIETAIYIISKYGAKQHAEKTAEKLIKGAWTQIDSLLPKSEAKSRLLELAEFTIKRSK